MATQTGIVIEAPAAPFKVVSDLPRSKSGHKQALVKSIFVAINPVEAFMAQTGILTSEMPAVLGSDLCGLVIETGDGCTRLANGDYVYGISRLGQNAYSPFQETFLVDEDFLFKKTENVAPETAAIVGAGLLWTAAFGIIVGGQNTLPEPGTTVSEREDWIVVLGGSGTVGQYTIQLGRLCGYKVVASCSPANAQIALDAGANATVDRHDAVEDQITQIQTITGGHFPLVFDTSAAGHDVGINVMKHSSEKTRLYTTTGNVSDVEVPSSIKVYQILLAELGRDGEFGKHVAEEAARMVPILERHVATGAIKPADIELFEGVGWDKLIAALDYYSSGKATKKIVVRVQD